MNTNFLADYPVASLYMAYLLSLGLALMVIPSIRAVARRWSLYDFDINEEVTLSHIPKHGGISLVVAFGISTAIFAPYGMVPGVRYILAALLLLLVAGIHDDLFHLSSFMRMIMVVGAGSILTDVAGMPMFYTGVPSVFNYPLADLLTTFSIFVVSVLLLLQAAKIPGLVALILIVCSVSLAVSSQRSDLVGMAVTPLALAGAATVLYFTSLGNYVFEGRASAMSGGFILAVLFISDTTKMGFSHEIPALITYILALVLLPVLVMSGKIKHVDKQLLFFGRKVNYLLFMMMLLILLISVSLI